MSTISTKQVGELQKVYSQLFLEGHIEEDLYRNICIVLTLHMLGFGEIQLMMLSNDSRKLDTVYESLQKVMDNWRI